MKSGTIRQALTATAQSTLLVACLLPGFAAAHQSDDRSDTSALTAADLSVCRAEFATLQADALEHFRRLIASQGNDSAGRQNGAFLTGERNRYAAKDPVTFYMDGVVFDEDRLGLASREATTENSPSDGPEVLDWMLYRRQSRAAADNCANRVEMARRSGTQPPDSNGPGPPAPGLRDMPVASAPDAEAPPAAPASEASDEVFGRCIAREAPVRSGITFLYHLRNVCQMRISFSYCLRANYEAAGDFNLCTRREYKTHSVAPGERIHFTFSLMPEGTHLSDGRTVGPNELNAVGHACTNDNSPGVYFRDGQFLSTGC